jgi:transcriptional regulator with XRE-family HTH domain
MSSSIEQYLVKMTEDDKLFFKELGLKISTLRKEIGLTQVQLAEILQISQQHMASFEKGIRKLPASMLPTLAKLYGLTIDELLGVKEQAAKRGPTAKLQRQIEQVSRLPKAKQKFVMDMLDTVIQQQG